MQARLDDIDRRILYYLRVDARNTTAPMIAEEVDVSAATIRNRINQLEEKGVITPRGETTLRIGDVVTVFSRSGVQDELLEAFTGVSSTQ